MPGKKWSRIRLKRSGLFCSCTLFEEDGVSVTGCFFSISFRCFSSSCCRFILSVDLSNNSLLWDISLALRASIAPWCIWLARSTSCFSEIFCLGELLVCCSNFIWSSGSPNRLFFWNQFGCFSPLPFNHGKRFPFLSRVIR